MPPLSEKLEVVLRNLMNHPVATYQGKITGMRENKVQMKIPHATVGAIGRVDRESGPVRFEIVSLENGEQVGMPLDDLTGVALNDTVWLEGAASRFPVGAAFLGNVVDSFGVSYDSGKPVPVSQHALLEGAQRNPLSRVPLSQPLPVGIAAIDGLLSLGRGQKQGIFAGSGVGKSVLLGQMAKSTKADVVILALLGERGREVQEFLQHQLGPEGRKKSVVVVETSDRAAVRRVRCAKAATTLAEYFQQQGAHVLLLMDSLTRFAMAQREIGMAALEPPMSKGYPPSLLPEMARLVERCGNWEAAGSITGMYTVLVENDDLDDPVADMARSLLDGHLVLSRSLAEQTHYPAIDILQSVSRVMNAITSQSHQERAQSFRKGYALYMRNQEAIQYGLYQRGSDPEIDKCIDLFPQWQAFLQQDKAQFWGWDETLQRLADAIRLGA